MSRARELFERLKLNGINEIERLFAERQQENLFIEFKRSADSGSGKALHGDDRKNLAKAISGFGNSEGGCVVWGVSGDIAIKKTPICDPVGFVAKLEDVTSGCSVPPHTGVEHIAIKENADKGYAVTLVPKSLDAPLQCLRPLNFFLRAGSSFQPVPRAILAGLFGKRPEARLGLEWTHGSLKRVRNYGPENVEGIQFELYPTIINFGPGIARDVYLNCTARGVTSASFYSPDWAQRSWLATVTERDERIEISVMARAHVRLAPLGRSPGVFRFMGMVHVPTTSDFAVDIHVGAEGSAPTFKSSNVTRDDVNRVLRDIGVAPENPPTVLNYKKLPSEAHDVFVKLLLPSATKPED